VSLNLSLIGAELEGSWHCPFSRVDLKLRRSSSATREVAPKLGDVYASIHHETGRTAPGSPKVIDYI
jgi:hypothetical protein